MHFLAVRRFSMFPIYSPMHSYVPYLSRAAGSLGGVVDDLYQDYRKSGGTIISKPAGSMSTAEAIAKHGPIDTWDTSQVTNMAYGTMSGMWPGFTDYITQQLNGKQLGGLAIQPVQRVPRYLLLLKELSKHCNDENDEHELQTIKKAIRAHEVQMNGYYSHFDPNMMKMTVDTLKEEHLYDVSKNSIHEEIQHVRRGSIEPLRTEMPPDVT